MTLKLSATSIKDYLACPQRFWYRVKNSKSAKVNKHIIFGRIVHEAIEKITDDQKSLSEANEFAWSEWNNIAENTFARGATRPPKSFSRMLGNYYYEIRPKLPKKQPNYTEQFFDLPYKSFKDVRIIGKIDKIAGLHVYDWKTGATTPTKYQLHDIQFYLYEWAYKQMYGRAPKVFYGHLNDAKLIEIPFIDELRHNLFSLIEKIIEDANKPSVRVPGYQCNNCFFRELCFSELEVGIGLEY